MHHLLNFEEKYSTIPPHAMMSTSNLYLEEKEEADAYDDYDQIYADDQQHHESRWKTHRGNPKPPRESPFDNAFLCSGPSFKEGDMELKNVDVFLDGLMESFLPCNSTETTLDMTNPLSSSSSPAPLGIAASASTPPKRQRKQNRPAKGKTTGKMFKLIKVKRGENIGLELCEMSKGIYITKVAKEGTGLKRGMRIIAINDVPCPSSVSRAIQLLMNHRGTYDDGYVTFVTGEEHDFAAPTGEEDSIQTDMGYV